mmetsp:Transcript_59241/g.145438  ORF Transcript_59241/g.145438 Transcript_59241/m.145438 type:complete len:219 (-) Transcript_59241:750-1406(-)
MVRGLLPSDGSLLSACSHGNGSRLSRLLSVLRRAVECCFLNSAEVDVRRDVTLPRLRQDVDKLVLLHRLHAVDSRAVVAIVDDERSPFGQRDPPANLLGDPQGVWRDFDPLVDARLIGELGHNGLVEQHLGTRGGPLGQHVPKVVRSLWRGVLGDHTLAPPELSVLELLDGHAVEELLGNHDGWHVLLDRHLFERVTPPDQDPGARVPRLSGVLLPPL